MAQRTNGTDHADEHDDADGHDHVRAFVWEVMRTGCMLTKLLGHLLDGMRDDTFPGEDPAEVLVEMLIGTIRPVADAAGEQTVRRVTALLVACSDRTLSDLRVALQLSPAAPTQ